MIYLICYDITDDRVRTKVADKLIQLGLTRIQYSVFMGPLKAHLKKDLVSWLHLKVGNDSDKTERRHVLILPVSQQQLSNKITIGNATFEEADITGTLNTLYIG